MSMINQLNAVAEWDREAKRAMRRHKLLKALNRKHWLAIKKYIAFAQPGNACFGTFEVNHKWASGCISNLRHQDPLCQACVIVTKLMEVLDA